MSIHLAFQSCQFLEGTQQGLLTNLLPMNKILSSLITISLFVFLKQNVLKNHIGTKAVLKSWQICKESAPTATLSPATFTFRLRLL